MNLAMRFIEVSRVLALVVVAVSACDDAEPLPGLPDARDGGGAEATYEVAAGETNDLAQDSMSLDADSPDVDSPDADGDALSDGPDSQDVAPHGCGDSGASCPEGQACANVPHAHLVFCAPCGGYAQVCCGGGQCREGKCYIGIGYSNGECL